MKITAFLKFRGNCREALNFYKDCFGGEIKTLKTFAETEYFAKMMPAEIHNNVQQAEFLVNNSRFFAYDVPPKYENDTYYRNLNPKNNIIDLLLELDSEKQQFDILTKLSYNGNIEVPLHETLDGNKSAEVRDKYGFKWILVYK